MSAAARTTRPPRGSGGRAARARGGRATRTAGRGPHDHEEETAAGAAQGAAWTLHQQASGKSQNWNVYNVASDAAMHRLVQLARQRMADRARRREEESCSDEDDDADAEARRRRQQAGGFLGILQGRKPQPITRAEDAPEEEPVPPKRAWRNWRPWIANAERAPAAARRFSVSDEDCERLSPEQLQATRLLEAGASCFVTGPGGTGKTELIRTVHKAATDAGLRVQITASTGIAARNVQGITLHRLAGLGLMQDWTPQQVEAAVRQWGPDDGRRRTWAAIDLLVVDEVSMLSVDFLLNVDAIARHCKDDRVPFGGIQLLLLGDFAQLTTGEDEGAAAHTHAFEHPQWPAIVPYTVLLSTCFRQKDARFRDMLNRLRLGTCTRADLVILETVALAATPAGPSCPELTAFRAIAADINRTHIQNLCAAGREAIAYTPSQPTPANNEDAGGPVPLCVGARVLLTRNLEDTRLVNGSLGTLIRFEDAAVGPMQPYPRLPVVQWDAVQGTDSFDSTVMPVAAFGDEEQLYMPLICAWALTVHRAQGMTLPTAVVHAGSMRTPALLYTALSRVKDLAGLQVRGHVRPENIVAHPRVVHYYSCLADMIEPESHGAPPPLAIVPTRLLAEIVGEPR
jgi:hypothetical protein